MGPSCTRWVFVIGKKQKVFKSKLDVVQRRRRRATLRGDSVLLSPKVCVFSTLFSVCNIFTDIFILLFFVASEGHVVQDVQPEMEKPGASTTPISPKVWTWTFYLYLLVKSIQTSSVAMFTNTSSYRACFYFVGGNSFRKNPSFIYLYSQYVQHL